MVDDLRTVLPGLIGEFQLACAILALPDGRVVAEFGDVTRVRESGLYGSLIGSAEAIRRLWGSLEGQLLPQRWAQGKLSCTVLKNGPTQLVVLFDDSNRSAVEGYRVGKEIARRIASGV